MFKHLAILTIASTTLLGGCASHKVVDVPSLSYDVMEMEQEVVTDEVAVRVNPVYDEENLDRYFGVDLIKYGILPVQLNVHNRNTSRSLIFSKEGVQLFDATGEAKSRLSVDEVMKEAKKSYWRTAGWSVALGVLGGVPSAINVANTNNKMERDFNDKLIDDGPIPPGSMHEGIVYFSVPKDVESIDGWKTSVLLRDAAEAGHIVVEYSLSGTVLARKPDNVDDSTSDEP